MVKSQNAATNLTIVSIDLNYADSFCQHLADNKIDFKRSKIAVAEFGWDNDKNRWEFIGNEIQVKRVRDFIELVNSWFKTIPPLGL